MLAADARDKKDAMLLVQAQVKDAESFAVATKKEAERLNKEAEEAQMSAASAASMQDRSPPPATNGYPKQAPSYGGPPAAHSADTGAYGMASSTPSSDVGFGGSPLGGFDANVMGGGGGLSIPTPSGVDDPYSNPFE